MNFKQITVYTKWIITIIMALALLIIPTLLAIVINGTVGSIFLISILLIIALLHHMGEL